MVLAVAVGAAYENEWNEWHRSFAAEEALFARMIEPGGVLRYETTESRCRRRAVCETEFSSKT